MNRYGLWSGCGYTQRQASITWKEVLDARNKGALVHSQWKRLKNCSQVASGNTRQLIS